MNCRSNGSAGFTLVETMIVMAIIGIMAAIATPTFLKYRTKAKNALAASEIRLLEREIKIFQIDNLRLPDRLSEVRMGSMLDPWGNPYQYLKIFQDEDAANEDGNDKKGKKKDKDNSGDDEVGAANGKGKYRKDHFMVPVNSDYDLYSMGEDGQSRAPFTAKASRDDIVRASDGKYVGLVSQF